jgi:hypothetical protein
VSEQAPEAGATGGGIMHQKMMGIPVPLLIIGGALIAYFLFFRNSSSSSSGTAASSTAGANDTVTGGTTTVDSGAVQVSVNTGPGTSADTAADNSGTSNTQPAAPVSGNTTTTSGTTGGTAAPPAIKQGQVVASGTAPSLNALAKQLGTTATNIISTTQSKEKMGPAWLAYIKKGNFNAPLPHKSNYWYS